MKLKDVRKIEFWMATVVFVAVVYALLVDTNNRDDSGMHHYFIGQKINYSYFFNFFVPKFSYYLLLYLMFLTLNFALIPALINRKRELLNYSLLAALILISGLILGVCRTYSHTYELMDFDSIQRGYNSMFFKSLTQAVLWTIVISLYTCMQFLISYLLKNRVENPAIQKQLKMDLAFGIGFWFIGLFFLLAMKFMIL